MSTTIFYGKTPIRSYQPTPALVHRLRFVANTIKTLGQEKIVKKNHHSAVVSYELNGAKVVYDSYYDDKTITVEGTGIVHLGMGRNESYYDINTSALMRLERKLGVSRNSKVAA
jgi:hypothetical protein